MAKPPPPASNDIKEQPLRQLIRTAYEHIGGAVLANQRWEKLLVSDILNNAQIQISSTKYNYITFFYSNGKMYLMTINTPVSPRLLEFPYQVQDQVYICQSSILHNDHISTPLRLTLQTTVFHSATWYNWCKL